MKEYIMRYENEVLQLLPDRMQELVRCKDCQYGKDEEQGVKLQSIRCNIHDDGYELHDPDWFCADGVRKEGR